MSEPKLRTHKDQFDGLKGIAILFVVLSHLNILNQGALSNAVFFALSGFLAARPFYSAVSTDSTAPTGNGRFPSLRSVADFYRSRLLRVIPSYYAVLIFVLIFTREKFMPVRQNLMNLIFCDTYAHLWFVKQFLLMCLLTPLLFVLLDLLSKILKILKNPLVRAALFLAAAILFKLFLTPDPVFIPVSTGRMEFQIYQYLAGISGAYLYIAIRGTRAEDLIGRYKLLLTAAELFILSLYILSSDQILSLIDPMMEGRYIGWMYPLTCSLIMTLLIFLLAVCDDVPAAKFLSLKPLKFLGSLSLQIYLIHWFLIPYVDLGNRYLDFAGVFAASVILAYFLNSGIGRMLALLPFRSSHT